MAQSSRVRQNKVNAAAYIGAGIVSPGAGGGGGTGIQFLTRPRIAETGDSRVGADTGRSGAAFPSGTLSVITRSGILPLAEAVSGKFNGPMECVYLSSRVVGGITRGFDGANQGFPGQNSTFILANAVPIALALKPDALLIQMGINDGTLSDVAASPNATDTAVLANIVAAYNQCLANVVPGPIGYTVPIITTVIPTDSTNGKPAPNAVNKLIRDRFKADPKCIFIDLAKILLDGADYGFVALSRFWDNGLHLGTVGGLIAALGVAAELNKYIAPAVTNWMIDPAQANLLPATTGNTGGKGSRVTGEVWTNWTVAQPSGTLFSETICSVGTDPITGFPMLALEITPKTGASNSFEDVLIRPTTANMALGAAGAITGKNYVLSAGVDLPDSAKVISVSSRQVAVGNTGLATNGLQETDSTIDLLPAGYPRRQWTASPALKLDAACTGTTPSFRVRFQTAGADGVSKFTVKLIAPKLIEVPDQATLWS